MLKIEIQNSNIYKVTYSDKEIDHLVYQYDYNQEKTFYIHISYEKMSELFDNLYESFDFSSYLANISVSSDIDISECYLNSWSTHNNIRDFLSSIDLCNMMNMKNIQKEYILGDENIISCKFPNFKQNGSLFIEFMPIP